MRHLLSAWLVLALCVAAQGQSRIAASSPASAPSDDSLAADSLRHSASSLQYAPAGTPARAGRLVALAQYAAELEPFDARTESLLAAIYELQHRPDDAAAAARNAMLADKTDHAAGLMWLRLAVTARDTATDRMSVLSSAADDAALPAPLRGEAASQLGAMYVNVGDKERALAAYEQALKLDGRNASAIEGRMGLTDPAPPQRVAAMLDILRGDPQAVDVVWELARVLDRFGMNREALALFEHARTMMDRRLAAAELPAAFVSAHMSAMLNDGQAKSANAALGLYGAYARRYNDDIDLQALFIEALQMAGEKNKAADRIAGLEGTLKELDRPTTRRGLMKELAFFLTYTVDKPYSAIAYARKALETEPDDQVALRVLACAQVRSGTPENIAAGLPVLQRMETSDAYAALCLAEYYYQTNDNESAAKALAAGAALGRSGPAWRRLGALAAARGVTLAAMPGAAEIAKIYEGFDQSYLKMAVEPEKFIAVTVAPLREAVAPGEAVELRVTLTNRGGVDVPIGREGLLAAAVAFSVKSDVAAAPYANLPMALLPSPRYLPAGASVSTVARIDVGALEAMLIRRPVQTVTLTIEPTLDPVQVGRALRSSVPTLKVEPATVRRMDLMSSFGPKGEPAAAYQQSLGYVTRDLKQGTLPQRMRAARQIGSLLAQAQEIKRGTGVPSRPLADAVQRPVLLSMMRAALADPSPLVRAEMTAALADSPVDDTVMQLLTPVVTDKSPLVRFRVAELLGASMQPEAIKAMADLVQDPDPHTRQMARAFAPATR
jgi:tetratricopeptide (TPR) repeat protein